MDAGTYIMRATYPLQNGNLVCTVNMRYKSSFWSKRELHAAVSR